MPYKDDSDGPWGSGKKRTLITMEIKVLGAETPVITEVVLVRVKQVYPKLIK